MCKKCDICWRMGLCVIMFFKIVWYCFDIVDIVFDNDDLLNGLILFWYSVYDVWKWIFMVLGFLIVVFF